jgi:hypothetical protein
MKIAVYGDSFGDDYGQWPHRHNNVGPGWTQLLGMTGGNRVSNFSEGGASFFYSFNQFNGTHHDHDRVIFMVTCPGRITLEIDDFSKLAHSYKHHPNYDQVVNWKEMLLQINPHSNGITQLTALENYFLLVKNDEYDNDCQWLLLNAIKKTRPDVIVIPCFHTSIPDLTHDALCAVGHMELEYLLNDKYENVHTLLHSTQVDARKCHMSEENNFIFYRKMIKFLSGEPIHIDINDFVKPTMPLDHYWRLQT